jgi:energy-coupling factor transport system permease protein
LSMRIFDGFKFTKLKTPIHLLDPRAKLVLLFVIFTLSILFSNLIILLVIFIVQIPMILLANSFKRWLFSIRGGSFFAILIFLANFITGSTLTFSLTMMLRFLVLISSFSFFFMTTSPDDLGLALEELHIPYALCFTFTTAVRLVPTMAIEAQTIMDAQRSRGLELDKGNLFKRIRNYLPILIPLIVLAIKRSIELAEALESRAFDVSKKRVSYIVLRLRNIDYCVITVALFFLILGVYSYLYITLPNLVYNIRLAEILPWKLW